MVPLKLKNAQEQYDPLNKERQDLDGAEEAAAEQARKRHAEHSSRSFDSLFQALRKKGLSRRDAMAQAREEWAACRAEIAPERRYPCWGDLLPLQEELLCPDQGDVDKSSGFTLQEELLCLDQADAVIRTARGALAWSLGDRLRRQGDVDGAIAAYRAAIAADPGHAKAHYNLGYLLYTKRRDFDGAIAAYRAAIAADPGHAIAHTNLGYLLLNKRKDFDGAEAAYRVAIAADPGHAIAHTNLGYLLLNKRKDFDGAEAAYRAAIAADPGHAIAHYNLGHLLHTKRKDFDGAEAAFRAAIAADPGWADAADAHNYLGYLLYTKRKDVDGAKAAYRAAIAADPGYTQLAHYNLGYLLMKETLRKYCFSCSFSRQRKVSPGKWVHDAAQVLATLPGI